MARKVLGRFDVWRSIVISDEQFDKKFSDEEITDWLLGPSSIVEECDLVDMDWEDRSTLAISDDAGERDVLPEAILDAIFHAARGISDVMRTRELGKISAEAAESAARHTAVETTLAVQRLIGDRMVYRSELPVEELSGDPRDPDVEPADWVTLYGFLKSPDAHLVELLAEALGDLHRDLYRGDIHESDTAGHTRSTVREVFEHYADGEARRRKLSAGVEILGGLQAQAKLDDEEKGLVERVTAAAERELARKQQEAKK